MPRLCAFGCEPSGVSLHRFPNLNKFPERFKTWVFLVGGKLDSDSDYECYKEKRICDIHFADKDKNRNNRLNALAVPTLHIPGQFMSSVELQQERPSTLVHSQQATTSQPSGIDKLMGAVTPENKGPSTSVNSLQAATSQPNRKGQFMGSVGLRQEGPSPLVYSQQATTAQPSGIDQLMGAVTPEHEGPSESVNSLQAATSQPNRKGGTPGISNARLLAEHNYSAASRNTKNTKKDETPLFNIAQVKNMRTQIKNLRSEICRIKKKGGVFGTRLENATKVSQNAAFQQIVERLAKPAQLFVNMQLQGSKKAKGRRFSIEEKVMCLSIFKKGPKCYALLSKFFALPSSKAMKRLLCKIKLKPGINPIIFEKIKKTLSAKDAQDRLCSLAFDEMSVTAQVNYNLHKDSLEGFACNKKSEFANHVLVFMVKSVKRTFKQPIAYYFTSCLNKLELKNIIKTVIRYALNSGLIIVNTVCDQSTVNVSAINELVNETRIAFMRKGREWRHDCFLINGQKIIPLFDVPHLIKGIRNNLLNKDMLYTTNGKENKVKWEYYQMVYQADKSYGNLKLLHKITEEHVDPDKINKMRVKSATQIFSHTVAVVTEHLTGRGDLPEECRQLIDITLLIDNLFDSLNVSNFSIPDGKIYKGAIKKNSPHFKLWCEAKQVLKSIKFISKKTTGNKIRFIETTVPSIKNLIKTVEGMEAIWQVLSKKYGLDAMLTRNFNQDPVENFFGNIRSYGARNNAPNTVAFEGAFKSLLLNNYVTPHSRRANCEEDKSECLQNLDFFLKENISSPEETSDIPEENIILNKEVFEPTDLSQEDAGQRNYVCGWVLTKCLKNVCKSCQPCRKSLLESNLNKNNQYIKMKEYNKKKWLCYPNEQTVNCFQEIQAMTTNFLKSDVPKINLKRTIIKFCDIFIDYPFKCITHKDALKEYFLNVTINVLIYSWCRNVNRILSGKVTYDGEEEVKKKAAMYYNKYKHYKNKK